jgi:uncharacterized protein (DUF2252 family)
MSDGRALRKAVPRAAHAVWVPRAGRDALAILRARDGLYDPELLPIRYGRMLASPFAFYRGAAAVMAADLSETAATGLRVQACGDCDAKNFGGFATPERNVVFDINDFDETLPGPWEWDLKRLAASFVLAARENELGESDALETASACVLAYRRGIRGFAKEMPLDVWYARFDETDFLKLFPDEPRARAEERAERAAAQRGSEFEYPRLAEVVGGEPRIRDDPPLIFHPEKERAAEFASTVREVLETYRQTLEDDRRVLFDRYRCVDAAVKVVGIGSVGTRCWIALMMSQNEGPLFLQFKQALASVMEPYAGESRYPNHGQRVVNGQRLMQAASDIFLGWAKGSAGDFYGRQLRDAKVSPRIETFDAPMLLAFAQACGWNLARAHAKTGDAAAIGGYLGKGDAFDRALAQFAHAYADQTQSDYERLREAVKAGTIVATP